MSAPTANRPGTGVFSPTRAQISQRTLRTDAWWKSPIVTDLGFAAFVIYATVRAFLQNNYFVEEYHYLTPFYSPCISTGLHAGGQPLLAAVPARLADPAVRRAVAAVPAAVPADLLLLPRRLLPVGVAVADRLRGGRAAREVHRRDAVSADHPEHAPVLLLHRRHHLGDQHLRRDHRVPFRQGPRRLRIRSGQRRSSSSTSSCCGSTRCPATPAATSWAARLKHFSKHPVRYWLWTQISKLNTRHKLYAWITLGTLMLTDFYIMLVASGTISDLRFVG